MLKIPRSIVRFALVALSGLSLAGPADARPMKSEAPCRVTRAALETLVLEESLETVVRKLGCPGALRSVQVVADDLRFQTRVWQVDVWPYGQFTGEFINGELHGMTKAWLDLSIKLTD